MKKICFFFLIFNFYNMVLADDLSISKYPETPKEGEEVTLTIESSTYDLNRATIEWSVDGRVVDSGIGRKTLIEKAPPAGTKIISLKITQDGLDTGVAQTTITPNTSHIFYEGADAYVPPFYKGRRLPSQEGQIRATVFDFNDAKFVENTSKNNYTWIVNDQNNNEVSGFGKTLNIIKPKVVDKSMTIKIKEEVDGAPTKFADVLIPLQKTETVLYKTDSQNLLQMAVNSTESGSEMYLNVEPYFFSVNNKRSSLLTYTWKINNSPISISGPWFLKITNKEKEITQIILNIFQNKKLTQENEVGFIFKSN